MATILKDNITINNTQYPVVYRRDSFVVNESPDSHTYDCTHVGTATAACAYLSKANAIALCNELVDAGLTGDTMDELIASPGWPTAHLIAKKYVEFSQAKPIKAAK